MFFKIKILQPEPNGVNHKLVKFNGNRHFFYKTENGI